MEYFEIKFLNGECFWGGSTAEGCENPFTAKSVKSYDYTRLCDNQVMPLFLSNKGRYIWSEHPFKIAFKGDGIIRIYGTDVTVTEGGSSLRDAYLHAMNNHFPFDGRHLPERFFTTAQYNSWMEFTYNPTQEGILNYARSIVEHGFEPGILIIDEGWHGRYGDWEFDRAKFPDPKAMTDELHSLGFTVMLWVVPAVCPDGRSFIGQTVNILNPEGTADEIFLRNAEGEVAIVKWWNGLSAVLDMRKKCDRDFLDRQLTHLIDTYGIDGFKFDGGNIDMYHSENIINGTPRADHDPHAMNIAWNEFGRKYEYHEYKDTFKGGGKNCIQRLCDRNHDWFENGINTLIPCSVMQGLMGMPFICPDMIGGGEWSAFSRVDSVVFSEELFIRMAQVSALCPMMQFSLAPWRLLSHEGLKIVMNAAEIHKKFADKILSLVRESEQKGEPVLRCLEYNYPNRGYELVKDMFMLGEDILVCPVITPSTYEREVLLPDGVWLDEDEKEYIGGKAYRVETPIEKLKYFVKKH